MTDLPSQSDSFRGMDSEAPVSEANTAATNTFAILLGTGETKLHQMMKAGGPMQITVVPVGIRPNTTDSTIEVKEIRFRVVQ